MKNILIISGSPRKGGNTDLLTAACKEGAESVGNKVTVFDAGSKALKPCLGCDQCYQTPDKACAHDMVFNELAPLIEKADVVVFATPMYWSDFSAQIKMAIDHMYGMGGSNHKLEHCKEAALLVCAASPESQFGCITATYRQIIAGVNWKDAGVVIAAGVMAPGDVKKTGVLDKARALGKKL
jgi:multimeric flavodoxin WrbA